MKLRRRVWVEIDLEALRRNYARIARHVRPARVLCVLKANAYGLGVSDYARSLAGTDCAGFGVAEPFEALELKRALQRLGASEKPVQILSSILPDEIPAMVRAGVTLPVTDVATARLISSAAVRARRKAVVHLKLDTGMGRLGVRVDDAAVVLREVRALPGLDLEGVFTHFPMAYEPEDPFTMRQVAWFREFLREARSMGVKFRRVHCAASDAINNFPECAKPPFNIVRTGINLHGSFDPNGRRALKVEPVLSLKTRVAQVRELPPGTTLGYGRTWCLKETTRVATISAGYADGLPLALTNRGHVLINGAVCPVIGRISMDYATVDATFAPDVESGDEVVCLGRSGSHSVTPDDWARLKGTHAYDIICSLGSRVERVAVGG